MGTDPKLAASNMTTSNIKLNVTKMMGAGKARTPPRNSFRPGFGVDIFICRHLAVPFNQYAIIDRPIPFSQCNKLVKTRLFVLRLEVLYGILTSWRETSLALIWLCIKYTRSLIDKS